jgi:pilus assembly protein Flp/PilA
MMRERQRPSTPFTTPPTHPKELIPCFYNLGRLAAPFHPPEISEVPFESESDSLVDGFVAIQTITTFTRSFTYLEQIASISSSREHGLGNQGLDMRKVLARFLKDETGATAIEYGLIAAGISVAIITVVLGVGTNLNTTFGSISTALK